MRRPFRVAAALCACCAAAAATPHFAHAQALVVRHLGADTLQPATGERTTLAFRIHSSLADTHTIALSAVAPRGWSVTDPAALRLGPDSSALRMVAFVVPADAAPGTYTIALAAVAASVGTADSAVVRIAEHRQLAVRLLETPDWVAAGARYRIRAAVTNTGNITSDVALRIEPSGGATVPSSSAHRQPLRPGATAEIAVEVRAPAAGAAASHIVRFIATDGHVTAQTSARVETVPQGRSGARSSHALSGRLGVRASTDPRAGPPVRLQLAGPLDAQGRTRVDMQLQGPSSGYSMMGEADEYRLSLSSPFGAVHLGDRTYSLSPLTEPGLRGAGAEAGVLLGPATAGGYLLRGRRRDDVEQHAAFARARLADPLTVGVNWLRTERSGTTRELRSAQAILQLASGSFTTDAEFVDRVGSDATGHSIDARLQTPRASVRARHTRVDADLGTGMSGRASDAIQITFRPASRMRFDAAADHTATAPRSSAPIPYRSEQQTARLSASYGQLISAEARYTAAERVSAVGTVDRHATSLRARLRLAIGPLAVSPSAEAGRISDHARDTDDVFWQAGGTATIGTRAASLTGGLDYYAGPSVYSAASRDGFSASLSGALFSRAATRVTFSGAHSEFYAFGSRTTSQGSVTFERDLPRGHRLGIRALARVWTGAVGSSETLLMLDYSLPLRVPVGGPAGSGAVAGRVYDGATGAPLQNVLVAIGGRRAATNADGVFEVRGIGAGSHALTIDRNGAAEGRVPAEQLMDVQLDERGPVKRAVDMALVQPATLTVVATIAADATASAGGRGSVSPIAGLIVELQRNGERIRRTTDAAGRIRFSDLRPGTWTVTTPGAPLPDHHRFGSDTLHVHLAPAAQDSVVLHATAVERRMRMMAVDNAQVATAPSDRRSTIPRAEPAPPATTPRAEPAPSATPPRDEPAPPEPRTPAGVAATLPTTTQQQRSTPPPAPLGTPELPADWTTFTVPAHITSLRGVAREVYLETGLWPKIWLANRALVADPERVSPGTRLRIPPPAPLTEPERALGQQYSQRQPR